VKPTAIKESIDLMNRCQWVKNDPLEIAYHDTEWGVPLHDDRQLFEFLILEGAQAGLSWITILRKRDSYRQAFDDFDPIKVASYDESWKQKLLQNSGIIRNRLKIDAASLNAQKFLAVQEEFGSFDAYIWQFVNGEPIQNHRSSFIDIPPRTEVSDAMSKDLKKRGFKFVGSTICYAFMQAVGMVNDHTVDCFRYQELI
jgi:DNA-3-methyladenine glycosylase I